MKIVKIIVYTEHRGYEMANPYFYEGSIRFADSKERGESIELEVIARSTGDTFFEIEPLKSGCN